MLNRCMALKWLPVEQQPILKFNQFAVYEYILVIVKHQSTNFVSPILLNIYMQ